MSTTQSNQFISAKGRDYLRLHLTPDVGPIRMKNLISHFGAVENILSASVGELQRVEGIGPKTAQSIFESRRDTLVDEEVQRAGECGVRILCWEDADFPKPLLNITDPPICLYVKGNIEPTDAVAVAIVGTRRCSHYGREQSIRFSRALAAAGFTVVSGLARGVDGHAHRGALDAAGRTIAVLGQGLATIYPPEHESLAADIAKSGAVVSELPVDTIPDAKNFPRRNRIIVGLSLGVIVIEAGERSGALISARLAGEYNREVFALPGRIDCPDVSTGTNSLIRDGKAKLITCLDDVLNELQEVGRIMRRDVEDLTLRRRAEGEPAGSTRANTPSEPGAQATGLPRDLFANSAAPAIRTTTSTPSTLTYARLQPHEQIVYDAIVAGAEDADAICATVSIGTGQVMSTLTGLQLKGLVRRLPGDKFVRRTEA